MRENSGTLGKNDRKSKPTHPDYSGSLSAICQHCRKSNSYWLSAWLKEAARGKFFSMSLKDKVQEQTAAPAPAQDFDDALPF